MIRKLLRTTYHVLSSRKFFYVIVGLLFVQAAWFALTVQYPMAFDENHHLGVIQYYSHQWLPFISAQPPGSESYGDLTRYDSYMFHYLMSFPYRIITAFTGNFVVQVMLLRFIDIGLFIGGMFLFRNLLRRIRISESLVNFSFLIFVLIPVVPFLAATINYDNLAFLIAPLFVSLTISCAEAIRRGKLPVRTLIAMLATGIFGSLVKFSVAPIFLAGLLYIAFLWLRSAKRNKIFTDIGVSFARENLAMKVLLVLMLILSFGLFAERYGVNFVVYHRYEPPCEATRSVSECLQYGPWGRDYITKATVKATNPPYDPPPYIYLPDLAGNYLYRLYFAINYDYTTVDPLPVPYYTAWIIGVLGLLLCLIFWKSIVKVDDHLLLIALVIAAYTASLFINNLSGYLELRTIVAANGRYLIPMLPFIFVCVGLAYQRLFTRVYKNRARNALAVLAVVVLCLTLYGGGWETHLLRSQPSWYWQSGPEKAINGTLKNIISRFVVGS